MGSQGLTLISSPLEPVVEAETPTLHREGRGAVDMLADRPPTHRAVRPVPPVQSLSPPNASGEKPFLSRLECVWRGGHFFSD